MAKIIYNQQEHFKLLPEHFTSPGFGSHSPTPIHVTELGPVSTSPGGQENVT